MQGGQGAYGCCCLVILCGKWLSKIGIAVCRVYQVTMLNHAITVLGIKFHDHAPQALSVFSILSIRSNFLLAERPIRQSRQNTWYLLCNGQKICSLLSISGTSTGPKKMVPLIEWSTYPNCSISGTFMKPKKVPLVELLPCLISLESRAFTNNERQGEKNKT